MHLRVKQAKDISRSTRSISIHMMRVHGRHAAVSNVPTLLVKEILISIFHLHLFQENVLLRNDLESKDEDKKGKCGLN